MKNKFVSPYPTDPVKIGQLTFCYWKFAVTLFFYFFLFRSKFILLKIPYFRFISPKDRYFRIKKKPTYLPTSKIVGRVRGNRNIFNCGLMLKYITLKSPRLKPQNQIGQG
jgi:hypothetical protein